ncbi:MAG: hypothetical protein Q4G69_03115 [Planctomycetia bacterium]|nr:hypothetical protein [Planctomycetia bacterium]
MIKKSLQRCFLFLSVCFFSIAAANAGESLVFDFESGNLNQEGWRIIQGENSKPIGSRDTEFNNEKGPYLKHGKYYLTTLEWTKNVNPTDDNICVIESPVFKSTGKEIRFLIGGGKRPGTFVRLCKLDPKENAIEVRIARGNNNQRLDEVVWNVADLIGQPLLIQVVDTEGGSWAHIRCDYFRIEGSRNDALTQNRISALVREKAELEARKKAEQTVLRAAALKKLSDPILYVTRKQYRPDHHNTATLFQVGEINEKSFVGGSSMKIWDPQSDKITVLIRVPEGIVRDPTISFDAKTVLFSLRKDPKDDYHIAEMDLAANAKTIVVDKNDTKESLAKKGIRQHTSLSGVSDIDPIYLPDGNILFASTREPKYCMCNRHIMCNLYTMGKDGSNIQQIGKSTLFEGHPSLLRDGRILYDRWEYVDRNFGDAQGVWVTNPDGTKHEIWWGNNTASPGGVLDTRMIPDSDSLFVSTFGSCHDRPWGAIALLDRRLGIDGREPVLETWPPEAINYIDNTPHAKDPIREVARYDRFKNIKQKFEDPYPLDESMILAAGMVGRGEEMGIWLLERGGKMALLHEDPESCFDPVPIAETEEPRTIGSRIDLKSKTGSFYITNVYEGMGMEKVKRGSVKYLRVVESPEKRFWTGNSWDIGNGTQAPAMAWDDFNNKRILGTVPFEDDGSVFFEVPAERFLYFQILDEDKTLIQSMRSGIMVRPGEMNGCVGCHESRLDAPAAAKVLPKAMAGSPKKLEPWYGPDRLFSYAEEVQPVFDKYCIACHDIGKKGAEKVKLCGDLNLAFNVSYCEIRAKDLIRVPGAGPHNLLPALSWGSRESRLAAILLKGHPDPKIDQKRKELGLWFDKKSDPEAFDRIITWIDINAPYYPTYSSAYPNTRFGRAVLSKDQIARLEQLTEIKCLKSQQGRSLESLDFAVWFTRPEMSPCLNRWNSPELRKSPEYKEALSIIESGKAKIAAQSRGEDEEIQLAAPIDIARQNRYERMQQREQAVRKGILEQKPVFDE